VSDRRSATGSSSFFVAPLPSLCLNFVNLWVKFSPHLGFIVSAVCGNGTTNYGFYSNFTFKPDTENKVWE